MSKKSFFARVFKTYAAMTVIVFLVFGSVFMGRVSQYAFYERQERLRQTLISVTEKTNLLAGDYGALFDRIFQMSMMRTARDNNVTIIVADPADGSVLLWVNPEGVVDSYGRTLHADTTRAVRDTGYFSGTGTLHGLLEEKHQIIASRSLSADGDVTALVYIAEPSGAYAGLARDVSKSFMTICCVSLVVTLLISYVTSSRMTRPLKTMSSAAREFARGDFSVRVPEDSRCEEIDDLARSFNNMAGDLEHLEELTRGFIGNVSHELKTPMTTIGGFVDGMLDGTIAPENRDKYLGVISEEVHRLSRMVVRMLDAAKIQSGELILASAPFDFAEMASQIILSFEQKLNGKNIEVEVEMEDGLMVMGDRDHVFRAVYNLVDNAVKFINPGGTLRLTAGKEQKMCRFSVSNTGEPIPSADLSHIFDRFYKVDQSRSKDRTGAGLGLYIVKNIINLHGGDISVRSGDGETEFSFVLPLAKEQVREATDR